MEIWKKILPITNYTICHTKVQKYLLRIPPQNLVSPLVPCGTEVGSKLNPQHHTPNTKKVVNDKDCGHT